MRGAIVMKCLSRSNGVAVAKLGVVVSAALAPIADLLLLLVVLLADADDSARSTGIIGVPAPLLRVHLATNGQLGRLAGAPSGALMKASQRRQVCRRSSASISVERASVCSVSISFGKVLQSMVSSAEARSTFALEKC